MSRFRSTAARLAVVVVLGTAAGQASAACTFGTSGEPSLQGTFNTMLGAGAPSALAACVPDGSDAAWTTVGSVGTIDIVVELAGNAGSNTFGVYDLSDPTRRLTVFEGNDGTNATATLRLRETATGWVVRVQEFNNPDDTTAWVSMSLNSPVFGFYLGTLNQGTFFSTTAHNADGVDHLYAYGGTNSPFLTGPLAGEIFGANDYLLAWEDLAGGGDRDYQDFVAALTDMTPVPLPTALWLLGSGLIGLAGVARRRT